jgi:glucose-6-phosphate 1-dehydrogenase
VEGRGDYYDDSGALRDMLQNHLLQLLCLVAMEPPAQFDPTAVRNEKIKVLRSLRPIGRDDVAHDIGRRPVHRGRQSLAWRCPATPTNSAAQPHRTFVALRAHVDNWRWSGVPFYLRTGKRLPARSTEIYIQFRKVPHSIFGGRAGATCRPNGAADPPAAGGAHRAGPDGKTPGLDRSGLRLSRSRSTSISTRSSRNARRIAYERLYLDAIEGNGTLFVRRDETEAAWQWVDAILDGWRRRGHHAEAVSRRHLGAEQRQSR